jgi:hypothetical protein
MKLPMSRASIDGESCKTKKFVLSRSRKKVEQTREHEEQRDTAKATKHDGPFTTSFGTRGSQV